MECLWVMSFKEKFTLLLGLSLTDENKKVVVRFEGVRLGQVVGALY